MKDSQQFEVVIATTPEERADVFRFRYRVLVSSMKRKFAHADAGGELLADPVDRAAMQIALKVQGRIVATLRSIVAPADKLPLYIQERFQLGAFLELSGLMVSLTDFLVVDTAAVDAKAANLLMSAAYRIACKKQSAFDFTHASAGEVAIFERLGYRAYASAYQDADLGARTPMVLPTGDIDHLSRVNSPFARLTDPRDHDVEPVNWFRREFAEVYDKVQPSAMSEDELWSFLTRRLDQRPHIGIPLLFSLDHKEAMVFLRLATILDFEEGERIVTAGDVGNEMFVILKGSVRIERRGEKIASFGRGGIFGEMAYLNAEPRTADVVAREETEVLILTQETMQQVMEQVPEVAARVLFNLSLILTERLKFTTERLFAETAA